MLDVCNKALNEVSHCDAAIVLLLFSYYDGKRRNLVWSSLIFYLKSPHTVKFYDVMLSLLLKHDIVLNNTI